MTGTQSLEAPRKPCRNTRLHPRPAKTSDAWNWVTMSDTCCVCEELCIPFMIQK